MNAKEMLLDYAAQKNDGKTYTNEQWLGKAMTEGIRIYQNGQEIAVRVRREGKTIILTETTKTETVEKVDGRGVINKHENTVEIFRVNL